jgi:hypothetical protein
MQYYPSHHCQKRNSKKLVNILSNTADTMTILLMTLLITTLFIMTILITLNTGDITYNGITYI